MKAPLKNCGLLIIIALLSLLSCKSPKKTTDTKLIVASHYLVRHAEKVNDSRDPGLTDQGKERAYFLAEHLRKINLSAFYSTDYFRTRLTAQPSSSIRNKELNLYDSSDLTAFSNKVLREHREENILIVGHSNTTPQLAQLLCPDADSYTIEHWEYDKLFKIDYYKDGSCSCDRINFGQTSTEQ